MNRVPLDVAIIGDEVAGWMAGALLARKGWRVQIFRDSARRFVKPLGDRLVPALPDLWRLPSTGPARRAIDAVGLRQDCKRVLGDRLGIGIVDDPDVRMRVPLDEHERVVEMTRVFGPLGRKISRHFNSFPEDTRDALLEEAEAIDEEDNPLAPIFASMRALRRQWFLGNQGSLDDPDPLVAGLAKESPALMGLRALLGHMAPFIQGRAEPMPGGLADLQSLRILALGAHGFTRHNEPIAGIGVRTALQNILFDVISAHSGSMSLDQIKYINVDEDDQRINSIETHDGYAYLPSLVIDASIDRSLWTRISATPRVQQALKAQNKLSNRAHPAIVRWLLPRRLLPRGLDMHTIVMPTQGNTPDNTQKRHTKKPVTPIQLAHPALLLRVYSDLPPANPYQSREYEDETVSAVVAAGYFIDADSAKTGAQTIHNVLRGLLPFCANACYAQDSLVGEEARALLPLWQGDKHVLEHHVLGGARAPTVFSNVVRGGRDLAPAFGLDGELAASIALTKACEEILGEPIALEA